MKHFIIALATLCALPAMAQETMDHSRHNMADMPPSSAQYQAANDKMHAAMSQPFTGNADIDFATGMIAHHQGAIDMAKVELEHGTDPDMRALAEKIVAAQEAEIAWMQEWLAKQPK